MGGALGPAVLARLAASRTDSLLADGESQAAALTGGYNVAFFVGAIFAAVAAWVGAYLLRAPSAQMGELDEVAREAAPCPDEPAPCNAFPVASGRAADQVA